MKSIWIDNSIESKTAFKCLFNKTKWKLDTKNKKIVLLESTYAWSNVNLGNGNATIQL